METIDAQTFSLTPGKTHRVAERIDERHARTACGREVQGWFNVQTGVSCKDCQKRES